jgi:hypothetical protein
MPQPDISTIAEIVRVDAVKWPNLSNNNYFSKATGIADDWRFDADSVSLAVMPMFHMARLRLGVGRPVRRLHHRSAARRRSGSDSRCRCATSHYQHAVGARGGGENVSPAEVENVLMTHPTSATWPSSASPTRGRARRSRRSSCARSRCFLAPERQAAQPHAARTPTGTVSGAGSADLT